MQYLIDASVYVFRAWHSLPDDMVDGEGNPVNAFYGYCRFIGDFVEQVRPDPGTALRTSLRFLLRLNTRIAAFVSRHVV